MILLEIHNRLKALESMYRAAKAAALYYLSACLKDPALLERAGCRARDVRDCINDLEDTYLVRVFAVFETALRDYWENCSRSKKPTAAEHLLNRVASRRSAGGMIAQVHAVRKYRNWVVHGGARPSKISLAQGRGYLCRFLGYLPRSW
jgi:hypothetical protein